MILEVADIRIAPGQQAAFDEAIRRGGDLFPQWRAIVGPFFAQPPQVEHFELVAKSA